MKIVVPHKNPIDTTQAGRRGRHPLHGWYILQGRRPLHGGIFCKDAIPHKNWQI